MPSIRDFILMECEPHLTAVRILSRLSQTGMPPRKHMPELFNSYRHGNILAFALMNNSREQVSMIQTDKTLDIQGISGPRAVIVIQSTLAGMNPGQILTVVTTCRTIRRNIEELCRAQGWNLIGMKEGEGITLNLQIRK